MSISCLSNKIKFKLKGVSISCLSNKIKFKLKGVFMFLCKQIIWNSVRTEYSKNNLG